jgi:hypothetical protein
MTTATILTLLVVPVFYTFFDDARVAFARTLKRAFKPLASGATGDQQPSVVERSETA